MTAFLAYVVSLMNIQFEKRTLREIYIDLVKNLRQFLKLSAASAAKECCKNSKHFVVVFALFFDNRKKILHILKKEDSTTLWPQLKGVYSSIWLEESGCRKINS
jgi:hypothetical protein